MVNPIKYHNLDLVAFGYQASDGVERFNVYVCNSPAGQQKLSEAEEVTIDAELRKRVRQLDQGKLPTAELIELGEALAARLFPPRARQFLLRSRMRIGNDQGLRIRLRLKTYALADLPWEYCYIPPAGTSPDQKGSEGFLALDRRISLVRYEVLDRPTGTCDPVESGVLRMMTLLANPKGTQPLALDIEQHTLQQALSGLSHVIRPEFYANPTVETVQGALLREAHIFHYAGHGTFVSDPGGLVDSTAGKAFLSLHGPDGAEAPCSVEQLALTLSGRGVRLAVLGASQAGRRDGKSAWTGIAPALNRAGIPAVVGMQFALRDTNALAFCRLFYSTLAVGQSIDAAMTEGRLAIFNRSEDDDRDWGVPVLYLCADEGVIFPRLASASAQPRPANVAVQPDGPAGNAGPLTPPAAFTTVDKRALRSVITQAFSLEELEALCADIEQDIVEVIGKMHINLEIVGGSGKTSKVLNLIEYLDRRRLLPYLLKAVRSARPGII